MITYDPDKLWPERLKLRETMTQETEDQLQSHFGSRFSRRRLQSAEADVRGYLEQDEYGLRRHLDRKRRDQKTQNPRKREYERY